MLTYKDYLKKVSQEDLKQHYEIENRSIAEACEYFSVSQAIFIRILKYYNFHKSKEAHTTQIKKSKLEKYGDENYNNSSKTRLTNKQKSTKTNTITNTNFSCDKSKTKPISKNMASITNSNVRI